VLVYFSIFTVGPKKSLGFLTNGIPDTQPIVRVSTNPGKFWNFTVQNSRPWKVLEKGIGPGKSSNYKPAVRKFLVLV